MTTVIEQEWLHQQNIPHQKWDTQPNKHAYRVAVLGIKIAHRLNLFSDDINTLYMAALLHELTYSKKHEFADELEVYSEIITSMKWWYDGSNGDGVLKGGAIPVLSRILTIADTYDTLIHKEQRSHEQALDHLQQYSGVRFDPMILPVAISLLEQH